jgi:RNA polymerase sigma-70 factor (ECF subfamily)
MTSSDPPIGESSFQALYAAHAQDVHRFALFLSGDAAQADDIVSETFVRLWHARERVDLATVKAYLFAIARNLYLQERRRTGRHVALDDHGEVHDPAPGAAERASARDELRVVLAALQALPEVDRAAVLMRAEDKVSYSEIAAALGISEASAKVKVHRARLKLAAARAAATGNEAKG